MAQMLPIFVDAQPAQGEAAPDAGIPMDAGMEIVPEAGMFQASLNEAIATLPRDLDPAPVAIQESAPPPVALQSLSVVSVSVKIPVAEAVAGPSALTWENGCQVGLALEPAARPGAYTFSNHDFETDAPPVKTEAGPVSVPVPKPVAVSVDPQFFRQPGPQRVQATGDPARIPVVVNTIERETLPVVTLPLPAKTVAISEHTESTVREIPEPGLNISRPSRPVPEIPEAHIVVVNPKAPIQTVSTTISSVPRPFFPVVDADLPDGPPEQGESLDGEIPKPVLAQKGKESFSDFSGNAGNPGRRDNPRPESEPLPEWEISLRAETVRPESPADRHPFAEAVKSPEPGAPAAFRAPLPQLPALLFQRLLETTGEMTRAEMRHQEFVVQVEPENLGRVQVAVEIHQGRVAARIAVDSDAVRQAMDAQLPALKLALEQQGLRLESIEVSVQDRHASLLNPEGRDSESFFHQRRLHGKSGLDPSGMDAEADPIIGETGRRFGFNTVEYFA